MLGNTAARGKPGAFDPIRPLKLLLRKPAKHLAPETKWLFFAVRIFLYTFPNVYKHSSLDLKF